MATSVSEQTVAGHTPGDWRAECEWEHSIFVSGGPNNDDIANLCFSDEHTVSITREEAEANARLIAASPMLLEGAQDTLEALKLLRTGEVSRDTTLRLLNSHIDELEYAIRAATGGSDR